MNSHTLENKIKLLLTNSRKYTAKMNFSGGLIEESKKPKIIDPIKDKQEENNIKMNAASISF